MKTILPFLTAALMLLLAPTVYAGPSLFFSAPGQAKPGDPFNVTQGMPFTVDVAISNVKDLYAFQFDVSYSSLTPNVIRATKQSEGAFLPGGGAAFFVPGVITNAANAGSIVRVSDTLQKLGPGVNSTGGTDVLAAFTFDAKNTGTAFLSIDNVQLLDSTLAPIASSSQPSSVTVIPKAVPEQSTLILLIFLMMTAILQGVRRRSIRSRSSSAPPVFWLILLLIGFCSQAQAQQNVVIFVPGIGGSILDDPQQAAVQWVYNPLIGDQTQGIYPVWPAGLLHTTFLRTTISGNPEFLQFNDKGAPVAGSISARLIPRLDTNQTGAYDNLSMPNAMETFAVSNYDDIMNALAAAGYTRGRNLFAFTYDFRRSVTFNAQKLADFIHSLGDVGTIDFVAHSMGGLVVRQALTMPAVQNVAGTVVLLDTPHLGAPQALKYLRYGDDFGVSLVDSATFKQIVHSLPGMYDLLPSRRYFELSTGVFYNRADIANTKDPAKRSLLNFDQTLAALKTGPETINPLTQGPDRLKTLNNALLQSEVVKFHDALDKVLRPTGVKVYLIAGYGQRTLVKMAEVILPNKQRIVWPITSEEGDGTVPLRSSETADADAVFYANLGNLTWGKNNLPTAHIPLVSNSEVQGLVASLLQGKVANTKNIVQAPRPQPSAFRRGVVFTLLTTLPHSTLALKVTDPSETSVLIPNLGANLAISGAYTFVQENPGNLDELVIVVPEGDQKGAAQYSVQIIATIAGKEGYKGQFDLWQTEVDGAGRPLRTVVWSNVQVNAPAFTGQTFTLTTQFNLGKDQLMLTEGDNKFAPTVVYSGSGLPLNLADLNGDDKVDGADKDIIQKYFGKKRGDYDIRADTNDDGVVDVNDLSWIGKSVNP